jgi:hypothetical protein
MISTRKHTVLRHSVWSWSANTWKFLEQRLLKCDDHPLNTGAVNSESITAPNIDTSLPSAKFLSIENDIAVRALYRSVEVPKHIVGLIQCWR